MKKVMCRLGHQNTKQFGRGFLKEWNDGIILRNKIGQEGISSHTCTEVISGELSLVRKYGSSLRVLETSMQTEWKVPGRTHWNDEWKGHFKTGVLVFPLPSFLLSSIINMQSSWSHVYPQTKFQDLYIKDINSSVEV